MLYAINMKSKIITLISVLLFIASGTLEARPSWKQNGGSGGTEENQKPGRKGKKHSTPEVSITIIEGLQDAWISEGNSLQFGIVAQASNGETLSYQWYFNGSEISGATSPSLNVWNADLSDQGQYQVVVKLNSIQQSEQSYLTVEPAPVVVEVDHTIDISLQPLSTSALLNDSITLNVSAQSEAQLYYQWRKDGVEIENAIHPYHQIDSLSLADSGAYDVNIYNEERMITSQTAQVDVIEPLPDDPVDETQLGSITLNWATPLNREDGSPLYDSEIAFYEIFYGLADQSGETIQVAGTENEITIDSLPAGRYVFTIATTDIDGITSSQAEQIFLEVN